MDSINKISQYKELLDSGVITQEEYDKLKAKALGESEISDESAAQAAPEVKTASEPKKSKGRFIIIAAVAVVAIAIIGILAVSMSGGPHFEGNWTATEVSFEGKNTDVDEVGISFSVDLGEDGTAVVRNGNATGSGSWYADDNDKSKGHIKVNSLNLEMYMDGKMLCVVYDGGTSPVTYRMEKSKGAPKDTEDNDSEETAPAYNSLSDIDGEYYCYGGDIYFDEVDLNGPENDYDKINLVVRDRGRVGLEYYGKNYWADIIANSNSDSHDYSLYWDINPVLFADGTITDTVIDKTSDGIAMKVTISTNGVTCHMEFYFR